MAPAKDRCFPRCFRFSPNGPALPISPPRALGQIRGKLRICFSSAPNSQGGLGGSATALVSRSTPACRPATPPQIWHELFSGPTRRGLRSPSNRAFQREYLGFRCGYEIRVRAGLIQVVVGCPAVTDCGRLARLHVAIAHLQSMGRELSCVFESAANSLCADTYLHC